MSPAPNRSLAIHHFKHSNVIEIRERITFDFLLKLPILMCSCVLFVLLLFLDFIIGVVFVVVVLYFLHPSHFTVLSLVARFLLERAVVGKTNQRLVVLVLVVI